jgi:predicted RNA binding protein YcfA (HicA-like mRNA interferase family)
MQLIERDMLLQKIIKETTAMSELKAREMLRETVKTLLEEGFVPTVTRGKHYKVQFGKQTLVVSVSPSDRLAIHNNRTILKKLIAKEKGAER